MTRIELDLEKSIEQNTENFFDKSKKLKKKLSGLQKAMANLQQQLIQAKEKQLFSQQSRKLVSKRKKDWFEKFRWFVSSDGLLVIGGRDAQTNDIVVKKFLEPCDLYFHADILGAPHCVLKTKNNSAPDSSKREAAEFAVLFSRAWQSGSAVADAYLALPQQVSKQAPTGEALGRGAFMIYGEREWFKRIPLRCGIGIEKIGSDWRVIAGPVSAVARQATHWVELAPGEQEKGPLSKRVFKFFLFKVDNQLGSVTLDDFIAALPSGKSRIVESK